MEWIVPVVLAIALAWDRSHRGLVVALVATFLGGAAVLAEAGVDLLPSGWHPLRASAPDGSGASGSAIQAAMSFQTVAACLSRSSICQPSL